LGASFFVAEYSVYQEIQMITLQPLQPFSLSQVFSRRLAPDEAQGRSNVIRHYNVSLVHSMLSPVPATELVRQYIVDNEGFKPEEIQFLPLKSHSITTAAPPTVPAPYVLLNHRKLRKQLERVKCPHLIYQYFGMDNFPFKYRVWNFFALKINKAIDLVGYLVAKRKNKTLTLDTFAYFNYEYAALETKYPGISMARSLTWRLPTFMPFRRVSPCSFLSLAFEESDQERAAAVIRSDLQKLSDLGLILGHFSMPAEMVLYDTIGCGSKIKALFCFLFINFTKLAELKGLTPIEIPYNLPLNTLLGLRCETPEGGVGNIPELDPSKKYVVETVNILDSKNNIRQAYEQSYLDSVETVNRIAKRDADLNRIQEANKKLLDETSHLAGLGALIDVDVPTLISDKKE
jgi:hypothetical protein